VDENAGDIFGGGLLMRMLLHVRFFNALSCVVVVQIFGPRSHF
jgi:hypothetical protein